MLGTQQRLYLEINPPHSLNIYMYVSITDPLLDPMSFTHRAKRSVGNAVNMALHFIFHHLYSAGSYTRLRLCCRTAECAAFTCGWITDFMSDRRQHVRQAAMSWSFNASAQVPLRPIYFLLCSSSCTQTVAHPIISQSNSLRLQMTPPSLDASEVEMSLPIGKRFTSW